MIYDVKFKYNSNKCFDNKTVMIYVRHYLDRDKRWSTKIDIQSNKEIELGLRIFSRRLYVEE